MTIKAVLFDFGGIFIDSPFAAVDAVAVDMGVDETVLRNIIFGDYGVDTDHPWHQLERGELSLEETRETVLLMSKKYDLEIDIFQVFSQFATVERQLNQPLVEALLGWKSQGVKLAMITNNIKEFNHWRKMFPFELDEVFDYVADSCEMGVRKPGAEIYERTLLQLGVIAEESIFVDDYPGNVDAAQRLGIQAYHLSELSTTAVEAFIAFVDQKTVVE